MTQAQAKKQDQAPNKQASADDKKKSQGGTNNAAPKLEGAALKAAVAYNRSRGFTAGKVKQIQSLLGVKADGDFGPGTTQAVYAFQVSRSSLGNDGKLGPATLRVLQSEGGQAGKTARELTPVQMEAALRYNRQRNFDRTLIRQIQTAVGVPVDGIFGRITTQAIATWQLNKGLVADGKVGPATLREMGLTNTREPHTEPDPTPIDSGPIPRGNVTANFSWAEFACRDGTPVPEMYRDNVRQLAAQLEKIRAAFGGRRISINSAYRHPSYNRSVGGASNSMHVYAKAADFNVAGVSPQQVRRTIEGLISQGKVAQGGMGAYSNFTHYDIRGYRSRW